ncbi:MAG: stage II sporulation protein R [Clostridia bacterium]|nr:stage II sporulation protein R [Clostridia bacterium]
MKKLILPVFAILLSTLIMASLPTEAEAAIYEDTVRLHILAASDSDEDQKLKLELRDELLLKYGNELKSAENINAAKIKIEALLPEIKDFIEEKIRERGYSYTASVALSEEWYDTREYESFTLPSGTYTSLRIIIDEGKGKNWWCVMFPPLCLDIATENAPKDDGIIDYTKEEINLISNKKYKIKFKVLELLSGTFR